MAIGRITGKSGSNSYVSWKETAGSAPNSLKYRRWSFQGQCTYKPVLEMSLQERFFHRPKWALGCDYTHNRQLGLLPGVKSTHHIEDAMETSSLQQAAGDDAAVSALAVHR